MVKFQSLFAELPPGIQDFLGKLFALILLHPVQFTLGHIPAQVKQFPDTLCGLGPGQQCCVALLCAAAGGYPDALRVIPDCIFPVIDEKTGTVGSILLLQKGCVIFQRLIFHEVSTDDKTAVPVIEADAKCFVNDLLGQLRLGEESELLIVLRLRGQIPTVHERNLLIFIAGRGLDFCIKEVGALVDEIAGQFRNDAP